MRLVLIPLALLQLGGTCDDPNQPPNVPTIRVVDFGPDFISVRFTNSCVDTDRYPIGQCSQHIHVLKPNGNYVDAQAVGGIATVTGLVSDGAHTIMPFHTDSRQPTFGSSVPWRTDAAPGANAPKVTGITPAEALIQGTVYIEGSGFTGQNVGPATLIHPVTGQRWAVQPFNPEPNRVGMSFPPSGLPLTRQRYFLSIKGARELDPRADEIILQGGFPYDPREKIRVAFVRWVPSASCGWARLDMHGKRIACACELTDRWEEVTREHGMNISLDPYLDGFLNEGWDDVRDHVQDTSREWQTMCGETWGTAPNRIGGLYEVRNRVTVASGINYWLSIDYDSAQLARMALRERTIPCDYVQGANTEVCANESGVQDYCSSSTTGAGRSYKVPSDCSNYHPIGGSEVVVHWVGSMWQDGIEINPNIQRAIAEPPSNRVSTRNMIVITDNPGRGMRDKWSTETFYIDLLGSVTQYTDNRCVNHWRDSDDPVRRVYDWGTSRPNLLTHELLHGLTGWAHTGPDPCLTPAVAAPSAACPRGFSMDLVDGHTPVQNCGYVVNDLATGVVDDDPL